MQPYQVDPYTGGRGPQQGYNMCNSTTENQDSLCQTSFVNSLDGAVHPHCPLIYTTFKPPVDFCLWGPQQPDSTIGETEGVEVAWCSKPGHGTRLIPDGALTGVQYLKTPDYVQVVGFINQSLVDIVSDDFGGELDPHGGDMVRVSTPFDYPSASHFCSTVTERKSFGRIDVLKCL